MREALRILLERDLSALQREVLAFPDDASLWRTLPGFSNSVGNLALHVAGNLRHFIGATMGQDGYVRSREAEFAQREGSREDVVARLEEARLAVRAGLKGELPERFDVGGLNLDGAGFLMHLTTHAAFHLGQAGTLRRCLLSESRAIGAMDLKALGE